MSDTSKLLLEDADASLDRQASSAADCSDPDRACIAWALRSDGLRELAEAASKRFREERSYQSLATLGFALNAASAPDAARETFSAGLDWLAGRSPTIAGETAPFVADAVAILGISLGADALDEQTRDVARTWLDAFASKAAELPLEDWSQSLFESARSVLEGVPRPGAEAPEVRLALSSLLSSVEATEDDVRKTLELARESAAKLHPVHAALRLVALRWAMRSAPIADPNHLEPKDVVAILERVPAGLRRWAWESKPRTRGGDARKWHIDHEYHVQDLLFFLLAPFVPDLKDEENFPSLGQKHPRADLFFPSMRLIIEVKFLRERDRVTKVIDEVASDASLYLKVGSDYSGLVAFVWDDSRRTEEHTTLIDGLTDIRGVLGAVVVPRPGRMREE